MSFEKEQIIENLERLSKPGSKPWATEKSDPATAANGMNFEGGPQVTNSEFPDDGYGGKEPKFRKW